MGFSKYTNGTNVRTSSSSAERSQRITAQVRRQENPELVAAAREYIEELDRAAGPDCKTIVDLAAYGRARLAREKLRKGGWDFEHAALAARLTSTGTSNGNGGSSAA